MSKSVILKAKYNVLKIVKQKRFYNSKIVFKSRSVKIEETLPFRVKFVNIGIPSYNSSGPAPIGIAVIGINNYVM